MSKSINQIILMGRVGGEPQVNDLPTKNSNEPNIKVAQFSLATSTGGYKRADGTEVPEKTEWHRLVMWRKLAEIAQKYVHKGDLLMVTGTLQYRSYEHKTHKDVTMYTADILVTDLVLTGRNEGGGGRPAIDASQAPQTGAAAGYGHQGTVTQNNDPLPTPPPSNAQDDLPF